MSNPKKIVVINIVTGKEREFKTRIEMAQFVGVDRMTVTRTLINKNKILMGVWRLKNPEKIDKVTAHRIANKMIKPCKKCSILLSYSLAICPICGKKQ